MSFHIRNPGGIDQIDCTNVLVLADCHHILVVELVPGKLFASKVGFMSRWWLSLVVCSLLVCFGSSVWAQEAAPQSPSVEVGTKPEDPAGRSIDANLYMQTSAEYRAACYQAFNLASLRLEQKLAKPTDGKPRAVVL